MTTTTPASMGEPLSEADRLAEIRNRAKHQKVLDHSLRGVRAKDHVAAVDDRDFLLGKVDALLAHNGVLVTEVRFQAERADSFRSERDEARARVGVLEGQLATAREALADNVAEYDREIASFTLPTTMSREDEEGRDITRAEAKEARRCLEAFDDAVAAPEMPRPPAVEARERPETPGTGSGRGTGVAEASGTAQESDDA